MDFKSLLSLADKQHHNSGGPVKRYSTDIPAPKKPPKGNVQSAAIRAFLQKKRQEEEVRALEFEKKKQELLELRSMAKHNRKATAMAKRTKDNNFMAHFSIADQLQAESMIGDRIFQDPSQLSSRSSIKDNGSAGWQTRRVESREPYGGGSNLNSGPQSRSSGPTTTGHNQAGPFKKLRPPPSQNALKFTDLLQLAAKKQHDPVVVQKSKTFKDEDVQGRLMTSEEKRRFVEEQVRKQGRSLENVDLPPPRQKRKKFREDDMEAREGTVIASVLPQMKKSQNSRESGENVRNGTSMANGAMKSKVLAKIPKVGASSSVSDHPPSRNVPDHHPPSSKRLKPSVPSSQNGRNLVQTELKAPQIVHSQRENPKKMKPSFADRPQSFSSPSITSKSKALANVSSREDHLTSDRLVRADMNGNHKMISSKDKGALPLKNGLTSSKSQSQINLTSRPQQPPLKNKPSQNPPSLRKEVQKPVETPYKSQEQPLKQRSQQGVVPKSMQSSQLATKKIISQDVVAKRKLLPPDLSSRKDVSTKSLPDASISAKQRALQDFGERHKQLQNLSSDRKQQQQMSHLNTRQKPLQNPVVGQKVPVDAGVRPTPVTADVGARRLLPPQVPKQFPPPDLMPRQFPPRDVRRPPIRPVKRRIESDDEYDEEMNDFIDDGTVCDDFDYSSHIKEIFGYDKSRYVYEPDDDEVMESSFVRQMQEEAISTRLGILEDLEDIQRENAQLRAKLKKKKK